jgi:alpha-galactosidase
MSLRSVFITALLAIPAALFGAGSPAFWSWADKPVMGWNSWDFYGTSINEERTKAQADYLAANLLPYGWNLITVDIQWYEPNATGFNYTPGAPLAMDAYGRLLPATNRFPSAMGGLGFKPLADYVHSKGLKFGIHMMRGIPRQAVYQNTPVLGTTNTAAQIANPASTCAWNPDMFGVDMTKPGAQEYYDSIMSLVASWEVDFVKIDDLSRPYHAPEIEAIRKAIDKTGRAIVLSTSPGATPVGQGAHVRYQANQWRISDDFWDNWGALYDQFQRLHNWTPYRGPGHFPDADMLPLGKIEGGSPSATGRSTYFTTNEHYTLMSLWAIARSPLIHGGDMTQMDAFTLSLLTNAEVIAVNQASTHNRQLFRTNDLIAWVADDAVSTNKYLALFNATGSSASVPVNLASIGFTNSCSIRSLWNKTELGSFTGTFSPTLAAHRGQLYRLSGPTIPVPWLTDAVAGNNQVTLNWEPIAAAAFYRVKRATSETGPYTTLVTGVTTTNYTDHTVQNGTTYYYAVSAMIGGQESPNSGARVAIPAGPPGMVSWNYDRYGTIPGGMARAGIEAATNWNNSWPDNPTVNLRDQNGSPTTVDIVYSSYANYSIQGSHPGVDANGSYNRELLNGYLNSGNSNVPTNSSISLTQIPFSYYDLYVYFSSDVAGRTGTITDGRTTFSFSTIGPASISSANAVLTRTIDTGSGYPTANYAIFPGLSGAQQNIQCNVPSYGGIAGFQIVPRSDPLPTAALAIQSTSPTTVTLSWPTGLGSLVLQESSDLQSWAPAPSQPATNSMVISIQAAPRFFRLARP